jgi:hypothetical protein
LIQNLFLLNTYFLSLVDQELYPMSQSGFSIAMLGGRGVGKTSMLTAMCHDFDRSTDDASLQLIAEPQTQMMLDQRICQLMRVAESNDTLIDPGKFDGGTSSPNEYRFELIHLSSDTQFDITFHDYPGGYLTELPHQEYLRSVLSPASVILVAIDTPALMQLNSGDHEAINMPSNLKNLLATVLAKAALLRRLVMFVPMRGEKWLLANQDGLLLEAFRMRFEAALRVLSYYSDSVDVLFCPVQTLGSVQFHSYHEKRALFEKVLQQTYRPLDCEQILRHSIRHLLLRCELLIRKSADQAQEKINGMAWWKRFALEAANLIGVQSKDFRERNAARSTSIEMLQTLFSYSHLCKVDRPFHWIQQVSEKPIVQKSSAGQVVSA